MILKTECDIDSAEEKLNNCLTEKMDWCVNFLESSTYKKYIDRRKIEFAQFHGKKTVGELINQIQEYLFNEPNYYAFSFRLAYIFKMHQIPFEWFVKTVIGDKVDKYIPDIERIIEYYFKMCLLEYWGQKVGKIETITKLDILRNTDIKFSQSDYYSIIEMCIEDILCKMYSDLQKDYYRKFSVENLPYEMMQDKYRNKLKECEFEISRQLTLNNKLQAENNKIISLLIKGNAVTSNEYIEYTNSIKKELDKVVDENIRLKKIIKSNEDYIESLKLDEVDLFEDKYNLEVLQSKKYLFVGYSDSNFQELKKIFPNSIFMTSCTLNIENIKIDAIVYLIRYMSHAMYYKVQNTYSTSNIPIIKFNGRNKEKLFQLINTYISIL